MVRVLDLRLFDQQVVGLTRSPSSINWYQRKMGAEQALHVIHWLHVCGLAASVSVWLKAMEMEISVTQRAHVAREYKLL